jgi:hypothetical protein
MPTQDEEDHAVSIMQRFARMILAKTCARRLKTFLENEERKVQISIRRIMRRGAVKVMQAWHTWARGEVLSRWIDPNLQKPFLIKRGERRGRSVGCSHDLINPVIWRHAKVNHWEEVIRLVHLHKDTLERDWVDRYNFNMQTALHLAAADGNVEACECLITVGHFSPLCRDRYSNTPVSISAELGHDFSTRLLTWYKPINESRRVYKTYLPTAKGRVVMSHKKYAKKYAKKKSIPEDDMEGKAFSGKTIDVFKEEWVDLSRELKMTHLKKVKADRQKKKEYKKAKKEAAKLLSQGFLPSIQGVRQFR